MDRGGGARLSGGRAEAMRSHEQEGAPAGRDRGGGGGAGSELSAGPPGANGSARTLDKVWQDIMNQKVCGVCAHHRPTAAPSKRLALTQTVTVTGVDLLPHPPARVLLLKLP